MAGLYNEKSSVRELMSVVPLKSLDHLILNWSFVKRGCRIMYMGLENPCTQPLLWLLILLDVAFQVCGAYLIQARLYIDGTGKNSTFVGIQTCLASGCGTMPTSTKVTNTARNITTNATYTFYTYKAGTKTVPSPGDPGTMNQYTYDFAWVFIVSMLFVLGMSLVGDMINARMRRNVAQKVQTRLFKKDTLLYRLTVDGSLDNIDQRLTSDLQCALDGFCCVLFGNSADYLAYPMIFALCRFSFAFANVYSVQEFQDQTRQGQSFGIVAASIFIAICAYIVPINHVSKVFFRGQRFEGDFRTTHTRAVLNAEQISMLRGEAAELSLATQQFRRVNANNRIYYAWQGCLLILRLFVDKARYASAIIAVAISATTNSTTANFLYKQFGDVLEYFLYFPVYAERLAYACGATHRVGQLLEQMERLEATPIRTTIEYSETRLELKGVRANPPLPLDLEEQKRICCCIPYDCLFSKGKSEEKSSLSTAHFGEGAGGTQKHFLFEDVNMVIQAGQSLCIVGPSGCGKSSLLRVIAGLWGIEEGVVMKPQAVGRGGVFFLPQKAYVFTGSLLSLICYPLVSTGMEEDKTRAKELLSLVFLRHLVDRYGMDEAVDWASVLSISEMQRMNFARMFYHEPMFCLADECTAALDLRLESFLYEECSKRKISMVSIAHRPTVIPHHDFVFKYEPSTHRWSQVKSASIATCGKFPTDGLEQDLQQPVTEPEVAKATADGFNLKFFRRLFGAFYLGINKCCSQV